MTQEEVLKMARQAGMALENYGGTLLVRHLPANSLEAFAKLVADKAIRESSAEYRLGWNDGQIAEREACAKVCDKTHPNTLPAMLGMQIRARGES